MKVLARCAAALLAVAVAWPATAMGDDPRPEAGELRIGLIPEMNIFRQKARFRALGEHLSNKIGVRVQFTILGRYGNIVESFRAEQLDGAFFGSFTGALAIRKLGVVPIARPVNPDGTSSYYGYVFVRSDAPFRSVEELRGKRMAFVDRATTAGYVFPLAWLRQHGVVAPDRFFGEQWFTGSHDAAIVAVLDGKADVGAAKNTVFDRVRQKEPRIDSELRIVAQSAPVPSNGLCVRPGLPPAVVAQLKAALLGLHEDREGAKVLAEFGAQRFIPASAGDYRPVHELATQAGIDLSTYEYVNR
jgi:phosphonate transport system substrate-binding protein